MKAGLFTGTGGGDQIDPMTVITPVLRGIGWLQHLVLWALRFGKYQELQQLRFIHFARWTVLRPSAFAPVAKDQPAERVRQGYLFFYTNFNGPWDQYIEAFALQPVIRRGMKLLWGGSAGFPGPVPLTPFKEYIRYFQREVDGAWFGYGDSTVRSIGRALDVERALSDFVLHTPADESADAFAARYGELQQRLAPSLGGPV